MLHHPVTICGSLHFPVTVRGSHHPHHPEHDLYVKVKHWREFEIQLADLIAVEIARGIELLEFSKKG